MAFPRISGNINRFFNLSLRIFRKLETLFNECHSLLNGIVDSMRDARMIARHIGRTQTSRGTPMGTAVFNAGRCLTVTDIEFYLAHILAKNGLKVYLLVDDGVLDHWDSSQIHKFNYYSPFHAKWNIRCRSIVRMKMISWAYRSRGLKVLGYSTILKEVSVLRSLDEPDKGHALSSTKRFFETCLVDTDGIHRDYYLKSLRNSRISKTVAGYALDVLKPDLFVTSHGIYSIWGPPYCMMKEANIPVIVYYTVHTEKGTIRLTDQNDQDLQLSTDWKEFDDRTPLSSEKVDQGGQLLQKRISHDSYDVKGYYPNGKSGVDSKNLGQEHRGRVFGMFPNVAWDGDTPGRNILFENVAEWCVFTINSLRKTPHHLFIRFHPSEATLMKGALKMEQILRERIRDIEAIRNLTLIGSEEPIDSYQLAKQNVDIGLIYDGTLCLELTFMGIPVIACTNGCFTIDNIVYKPSSLNAYRSYLKDPNVILKRFRKEATSRKANACKYAYWLFKESHLQFKPLAVPYMGKMNYALLGKGETLSADERRILDRLTKPLPHGHR